MSLEHTVIDNIKRIRKEKGISQEKLAEFCGTSTSYIGLMEIYKNIPKLSTIERIATALQVSPQTLFAESEEERLNKEKKLEIERKNKLKKEILISFENELERILGAV